MLCLPGVVDVHACLTFLGSSCRRRDFVSLPKLLRDLCHAPVLNSLSYCHHQTTATRYLFSLNIERKQERYAV